MRSIVSGVEALVACDILLSFFSFFLLSFRLFFPFFLRHIHVWKSIFSLSRVTLFSVSLSRDVTSMPRLAGGCHWRRTYTSYHSWLLLFSASPEVRWKWKVNRTRGALYNLERNTIYTIQYYTSLFLYTRSLVGRRLDGQRLLFNVWRRPSPRLILLN